jgi:hypothetical protein
MQSSGALSTPSASPVETSTVKACPVTKPVLATPPEDSAVLSSPVPGYYFINADRSIWASAWGPVDQPESHWQVNEDGLKVGWFRPAGAQLEITGQRLDAADTASGASTPLNAAGTASGASAPKVRGNASAPSESADGPRTSDAAAPPFQAHVPCCYPTRFQASGLTFPTAGCWEVTAKAAGSRLTFVVEVEPYINWSK